MAFARFTSGAVPKHGGFARLVIPSPRFARRRRVGTVDGLDKQHLAATADFAGVVLDPPTQGKSGEFAARWRWPAIEIEMIARELVVP